MARNETPLNIPAHRPTALPATAFLRATALFVSVKNRNKQLLRIKDFRRDDAQGVDRWQAAQHIEAGDFNSANPGNEIKVNVNCFTCWS